MPTRGALTRDGTELVYWTWPGASPPALLLHGIGNYGRYWDLFADAIAGRLQLVRGVGTDGLEHREPRLLFPLLPDQTLVDKGCHPVQDVESTVLAVRNDTL